MAAAATLELKVILVAATTKRAWSCCAFKDSTVRRFRPKTSGTNETLTSEVNRLYSKTLALGTGEISSNVFARVPEKLPETWG